MDRFFSSILIPVDFSVNTKIAIEKAIWLSAPGFSIIHLLHVQKDVLKTRVYHLNGITMPEFESHIYSSEDAETRLQQLKAKIEASLHSVIVVTHLVKENYIQKGITYLAKQLHPSLIIIAESNSHKWFPFFKKVNTNVLAKDTNCPVLTVKAGSIPNRMKSVVMLVRSFMPERKIELLLALTRNHRPVIHLVTMYHNEHFNSRASVFLNTYRRLSDYLHFPVEYKALKGRNVAKTLFDYTRFIMADFIIVNPGEETKISAIYGTDICDVMAPESKLNILIAEPFKN